mmetsp:Transcript_80475/g.202459  ORF Transcript_80475/g.202459 Transcript_80475/m.202459 type:complete len:281 (+) Transcript_80475:1254-2096(+)
MQRFQDDDERRNVELRLATTEHAHLLICLYKHLPACDELCEHVDAILGLKRLYESNHKWMVQLCQETALPLHLLGHLALLLADPLQSVAEARAAVLHEAHGAEGADADAPHVAQGLQGHARLLELDPFDQLLAHLLRQHPAEVLPVQGPDLRRGAGDLHSGTPWLVKQHRSLTKTSALAEGADCLAIDGHLSFAARQHEEAMPDLPLLENHGTLLIALQHQRVHQAVDLVLCEVPEDRNLPRSQQLLDVVADLFLRVALPDACEAEVQQGLDHGLFRQDC